MASATARDGARVWFETSGDVTGPGLPLVLVQGFALDHHGWDSAIDDFSGRPVVVLDHRGTGDSDDRFADEWSMRDFAGDIISVLDEAGIDRAHIYGHSMGGRIAQWLGARHADRIAGLVIGATTVGDDTGVPRSARASEALESGDPDRLAAFFYPDAWIAAHREAATSVMPAAASPTATRQHLAAIANHDGPTPAQIAAPALVIHGADDELCPMDNARLLAMRIPRAELRLIDGARHVYWAGMPEAHRDVNDFLRRHDRVRPMSLA
ncbi:alpha/beta hydrolase [Microbacterium yannicii]|uniref:Alpha/beta hydrolase n=1 Tax=Microbacterium yannicii TaxID=671622 RepID=A0ABP9LXB2_9MICO|nr:alpha/beta fold hydrolase [Microbacterium yannicii]MCO5953720.1 alpha/beta hydrolase [Microbacterium yannicii]